MEVEGVTTTAFSSDHSDGSSGADDEWEEEDGLTFRKRHLPCFDEVYGKPEALEHALHRETLNGQPIHAVLSWALPQAADLCLLAIDASGFTLSPQTRQYLETSSTSHRTTTDSDKQHVLELAHKRRYFEAELTCAPLQQRIEELQRQTNRSSREEEELAQLKTQVERNAVVLEYEVDVWMRVVFVKMHVPFTVRCAVAQKLQLMMPLKRSIRLARRKRNALLDTIDPLNILNRIGRNRVGPAGEGSTSERPTTSRLRRRTVSTLAVNSAINEQDAAFLILDEDDEEIDESQDEETLQEITAEFSLVRASAFRNFSKPDLFFTPAQNLRLTRQILLERPFTKSVRIAHAADGNATNPLQHHQQQQQRRGQRAAQVNIQVEEVHGGSGRGSPDQEGSTSPADIQEEELIAHAYRSRGYQLLVADGAYSAVFPLHDTTAATTADSDATETSAAPTLDAAVAEDESRLLSSNGLQIERSHNPYANLWLKLVLFWSNWRNWRHHQPLRLVKNYFGEKVAFYFLWLEFYTTWLVAPALLGFVVFFLGFALQANRTDVKEYCASNKTMCAVCSSCDQFTLQESCNAYKTGYLFDNGATVVFSLIMSVWSTLFLEFWKRTQNRKAYAWRVRNFEETEPHRPQFRSEGVKTDDVTGLPKPFFPFNKRLRRYIVSFLTVTVMLGIVILAVVGVILARTVIRTRLYESSSESVSKASGAITSVIGASLSLFIILALGKVYARIALTLTRWENHERESEFERALAIKVFLFEFVNNFASIFFVAFFKGQFIGRPGKFVEFFGYRQDACPEYGCLIELTIQLSVIMVGKQSMGNVKEVVIPYLFGVWKRWSLARRMLSVIKQATNTAEHGKDSSTDGAGHANDAQSSSAAMFSSPLAVPQTVGQDKPFNKILPWAVQYGYTAYPGLFREYLEMILQFGFTTLFVASFPLAPIFALLNNIVEIRLDAKKHMHVLQRPFGFGAENIGIWQHVLSWVSIVAVITNAFVIAITSSFIPRYVYTRLNGDLAGFVDASLAKSPVTDPTSNQFDCYYSGYRNPDGSYSTLHFQIMMARFAFVLIFEHVVYTFKYLLSLVIYDVPSDVEIKIRREEYQAKIALDRELARTARHKKNT
ncbi:hypothetical protein PTSG_02268 [Salpingoeca rosetta]|uniref:Anoctamin n=1 Tax=Salpingoeca rosetta (strain ATCC 50818 / BSB-021) TaxID=946362 RepID=F2U1Q0_SALR5|nr:uncharacterized protein PTSG_02268 [Salpingoeca rosetta]EGD81552.1 hypothetical protein PTSG_02268 [Salpingoeca rosetta]|eukprot:XP_004996756.1 hypothetical protein PTSG_02268 [Salpingoeca rosetta]